MRSSSENINCLQKIDPAEIEIVKDERNHSDCIPKGVSSKVYFGKWKNDFVAVKWLKNEKNKDQKEKIKRWFNNEIEIVDYLQSKNTNNENYPLVKMFGFNNNQIIMEYMDDGNLLEYIIQPIDDYKHLTSFAFQIYNGISFLHSNNVIHRDLKPENVIINDDQAKLCDFGLAVIADENNKFVSNIRTGSKMYCAPELINPDILSIEFSFASDMFAAGKMTYIMMNFRNDFIINIDDRSELYKDLLINTNHKTVIDDKYIPQFSIFAKRSLSINPQDRPTAEEGKQLFENHLNLGT